MRTVLVEPEESEIVGCFDLGIAMLADCHDDLNIDGCQCMETKNEANIHLPCCCTRMLSTTWRISVMELLGRAVGAAN